MRCADYVEQFGFKAESPPELGCYIHGLYIEGCTWDADNNTLTESEPKTLFVQMPTIHIVVAQSAEMGDRKNGYYAAPVYRTTERRGTLSTTVRTAEYPHFSKGARPANRARWPQGHSTNFVLDMALPSKLSASHWVKRGVALFCALAD